MKIRRRICCQQYDIRETSANALETAIVAAQMPTMIFIIDTDLADGKVFGERTSNTTSSAWGGVFAKMTPQQVDAIASRVFGELATAASN